MESFPNSTGTSRPATDRYFLRPAVSLLEEVSDLSGSATSEELDEDVVRSARLARSAGWVSNMSSRSVVPPDYDMLEKPPSPTPGEC